MKAKNAARIGMLCAASLVLGYLESLLPAISGIPGVKLGLSNCVVLFSVYTVSFPACVFLVLCKVLLSGFMFAGLSAMLYSLAGGILSLCVMGILRKFPQVSPVGASACGGVSHNIGQLCVAALVVGIRPVLAYLPVLLLSGTVSGILTGIATKYTLKALGGRI